MFAANIKHYIGAYLAVLGGADAIVFTGGIGENSRRIRTKSLEHMECGRESTSIRRRTSRRRENAHLNRRQQDAGLGRPD